MEAVSSLGIRFYAMEVSTMMFLGMITNLILARFGRFPYIFLTGHHILYMACLLAVVFHQGNMESWQIVVAGSLILRVVYDLHASHGAAFYAGDHKRRQDCIGTFLHPGICNGGKSGGACNKENGSGKDPINRRNPFSVKTFFYAGFYGGTFFADDRNVSDFV